MTTKSIESVLSRAMSDSAFAEQLFANPDQALASFDLTSEEITKFKGMSRAEFETIVSEDRKSFAVMISELSVKYEIRDSAHLSASIASTVQNATNHNQTTLKVKSALSYPPGPGKTNHNETMLKVK